jgi:hypothetical protein
MQTQKTFIVLGNPRGGTSLVAGTLIGLGVYMGQYPSNQYECKDFKALWQARQVQTNGNYLIRDRNEDYKYWGWKLPNTIYFIKSIFRKLHNPHFIAMYRDPVENAASSIKHEGQDYDQKIERITQLMKNHRSRVEDLHQFFESKGFPVLSLQLDECHNDLEEYLKKMENFCDLPQKVEPNYNLLTEKFLNPQGGYSTTFEDHKKDLKILR